MAYYRGTFRSLDQSVDQKGQRYDVLIFTGYDAATANAVNIGRSGSINLGPYPYENIMVGSAQSIGEIDIVFANIPVKATELTMTDHPFVVNYAGDGLEKPYRCSAATISFLQSSFKTDFINSMGQNVLVFLLKWRNTIHEVDGHLEDSETGATLSKHQHQYTSNSDGPWGDRVNVYWNDYYPWEYDNFCFDVEWVGFSTPTMLNTEYSHCVDRFSMECQDAFSTLQYIKFERTEQMETMLNTLLRALQTLGIYRKVYITNDVRFAPTTNDLDAVGTVDGTALKWMAHQQDNCYDENGIAMDYRKLLENMMNYLGLTIIPEGDSLFIISDHCIGDGHTEYKLFEFANGSTTRLWSLPAENPIYNGGNDVNIVSTRVLGKEDFCGGSTQLSSDVMYNKAVVTCDEMRPNPLLPDFDDVNNYVPEIAAMDQPMALNLWNRHYVSGDWENYNFHYFECYLNRSNTPDIKFYRYPEIEVTSVAWPSVSAAVEVQDSDLYVTHARRYAGQAADSPLLDWVSGIIAPPPSDGGSAGLPSCMACMVDYEDVQVSNTTEQPTTMSLSKAILLATPPNYTWYRYIAYGDNAHNWDDKTTYWNPMLYIKSKPFLGTGKQYLNITGSFTYYGSSTYNGSVWYPAKMEGETSSYYKFDSNNNFIYCKIKMGNYWLTNNGRGQYAWDTIEDFCKLWFDNSGKAANDDYRWTAFPFETVIRGVEGITVEMPTGDGYAEPMEIEIWIDRPLGPGASDSLCPHSTIIDGLDVNVYSDTYVESRKRREPDKDNTTYENVINEGSVEEGPRTDLIHSSTDEAGMSYAETAKHTIRRHSAGVHVYRTNPMVMNDGAGYYGIPEQNNINCKCNQYKTPTLQVSTEFFRKDIKMHTRVLWPTQLPGHRFIINSMEIDYEYEQARADLMETKAPAAPVEQGVISPQVTVSRVNQTRNYHRTDDIMFDGHIARRNPKTLDMTTVTGNEVDDSNAPQYSIDTDNPIDGASRFNIDFATGQIRMTTPVGSNVSAERDNNQVVVTTE